jgi:hypothetical protein
MTRRILGADSALHEGRPVIRLAVHPGKLQRAEGRVFFPTVGWADIAWRRKGETIIYRVDCPAPWALLKDGAPLACQAGTTELRLSSNGIAFVPEEIQNIV